MSVPLDVGTAPAAGERVALEISDEGRVALAERLGSGLVEVEGRLVALSPAAFDMQVFKVRSIRDGEAQWSGERVSIPRAQVARVNARALSRGRTVLAVAGIGGGIIAFIVTRQLLSGGRERDPSNPPTGPETIRISLLRFSH
ncbi:MAG: hypothetical protein IT361_15065 [Gemmatimonadaceae bacterium]|nr:hypothetical protein [Gemmatimonadaceae bacterium]